MRDKDSLYWVWLALRMGVASKEFPSFYHAFPDPYEIYRLSEEEIGQIEGLSIAKKEALGDKSLNEAYNIIKYCRENKIGIISYADKEYPARLRTIEDPPIVLYCKGQLPDMNRRLCVGMVGTRRISEYGKQTSYKISYELSAARAVIVSGMALGVDGVCAAGVIAAGGATVAVLGCGLSIVYPKEHTALMKEIVKKGAVISEYPPFERPFPGNFPKRNRIISGLCQGVVVVEGAQGSGALITASRALSQGRELFAVPGKVNESNSEGPNELIRNGANVVTGASDLIEHYDFLYHDMIDYRRFSKAKRSSELDEGLLVKLGVVRQSIAMAEYPEETREEVKADSEKEEPKSKEKETVAAQAPKDAPSGGLAEIYGLLPEGAFTPDVLTSKGIGISEAMTALTMLEISGHVISLPGGAFKKA